MRGFNKPTFPLSWEKKVVEMCQNLSCVQVWLLQNGPGNNLIVSDQAVNQFSTSGHKVLDWAEGPRATRSRC